MVRGYGVEQVLALTLRIVVRFSVRFPEKFGGQSLASTVHCLFLKIYQCSFTKNALLNKELIDCNFQ